MDKNFTLHRMLNAAQQHTSRKIKQFEDLLKSHGDKEIIREYLEYWKEFEEAIFYKQCECPSGSAEQELITQFDIETWEAPGETEKQWCYRLSIAGIISLVHGNNFASKEAAFSAAKEEMEAYRLRLSK
jgi:hypothetical protein